MDKRFLTGTWKSKSFLWALIIVAATASQGQISEPLKKFNDKTLQFYLGFNQKTLNAEIASGQAEPLKLDGKPIFKKGVFGSAVFLKKGRIAYKRMQNMPATDESGTICFWYYPVDWDLTSDAQANNIIFRSQYPYSGLSRTGLKKRNGKITCFSGFTYYLYREIDGTKKNYGLGLKDPMHNKKWFFIALRWSKSKVTISVNAESPGGNSGLNKTRNFLKPIGNKETLPEKKASAEFSFSMPSPGMLDEVMIFNRNLSGEELLTIYQAGIKDIGKKE
jgi:hypothetical protein